MISQEIMESPGAGIAGLETPSDLTQAQTCAKDVNVHHVERIASAVVGGSLIALGLSRRSLGGAATAFLGGSLLYRGVTGHCHMYEALGVDTAAKTQDGQMGAPEKATQIQRSITIERAPDMLYQAWKDPQNMRRIYAHFADVSVIDDTHARWVIDSPIGQALTWEAHVVEDRPGEMIRWESVPGASIPNEGFVRFRPANDGVGSVVTLRARFDPPGGVLGDVAMKIAGMVPELMIGKALRRFKALMEAGEIPTTQCQPSARNDG